VLLLRRADVKRDEPEAGFKPDRRVEEWGMSLSAVFSTVRLMNWPGEEGEELGVILRKDDAELPVSGAAFKATLDRGKEGEVDTPRLEASVLTVVPLIGFCSVHFGAPVGEVEGAMLRGSSE
jgi:hypothetical protein